MISILIPARRDSLLLHGLIHSIYANVHSEKDIEVWVSASDKEVVNKGLFKDFNINVHYQNKNMGRFGLDNYMNAIAGKCTGDLLWHMCDDFRITTKYFDLVLEEMIEHSNDIYHISGHPTQPHLSGATAPIITRAWFDTLGVWSRHYAVDSYVNTLADRIPQCRRIVLGDLDFIDISLLCEMAPPKDEDFKEGNDYIIEPFNSVENLENIEQDANWLNNAINKGK